MHRNLPPPSLLYVGPLPLKAVLDRFSNPSADGRLAESSVAWAPGRSPSFDGAYGRTCVTVVETPPPVTPSFHVRVTTFLGPGEHHSRWNEHTGGVFWYECTNVWPCSTVLLRWHDGASTLGEQCQEHYNLRVAVKLS